MFSFILPDLCDIIDGYILTLNLIKIPEGNIKIRSNVNINCKHWLVIHDNDEYISTIISSSPNVIHQFMFSYNEWYLLY